MPNIPSSGGCCEECCAWNYRMLRIRRNFVTVHIGQLLIQPYVSHLPLARSQSVSQGRGMHQAVLLTTPTIPTPLLQFETFCSSSTRNKRVKWGEISSDVTENGQRGWAVQIMLQNIFLSRFPHKQKSQTLISGDLGGHKLVLMILSLNTSCNALIILCSSSPSSRFCYRTLDWFT